MLQIYLKNNTHTVKFIANQIKTSSDIEYVSMEYVASIHPRIDELIHPSP